MHTFVATCVWWDPSDDGRMQLEKFGGLHRKLPICENCIVLAMIICLSLPPVLQTSKYANWLNVSGPVITTLRIICANINGYRLCSLWGKIRFSKCNLQQRQYANHTAKIQKV
jgi:formate hydrogenlyase subunit 3/multisubunit Na+/H+ antiporter MnhD subunit